MWRRIICGEKFRDNIIAKINSEGDIINIKLYPRAPYIERPAGDKSPWILTEHAEMQKMRKGMRASRSGRID